MGERIRPPPTARQLGRAVGRFGGLGRFPEIHDVLVELRQRGESASDAASWLTDYLCSLAYQWLARCDGNGLIDEIADTLVAVTDEKQRPGVIAQLVAVLRRREATAGFQGVCRALSTFQAREAFEPLLDYANDGDRLGTNRALAGAAALSILGANRHSADLGELRGRAEERLRKACDTGCDLKWPDVQRVLETIPVAVPK